MNCRIVVNTVHTRNPHLEIADETLDEFHDVCKDIMFRENLPEDLQDS